MFHVEHSISRRLTLRLFLFSSFAIVLIPVAAIRISDHYRKLISISNRCKILFSTMSARIAQSCTSDKEKLNIEVQSCSTWNFFSERIFLNCSTPFWKKWDRDSFRFHLRFSLLARRPWERTMNSVYRLHDTERSSQGNEKCMHAEILMFHVEHSGDIHHSSSWWIPVLIHRMR